MKKNRRKPENKFRNQALRLAKESLQSALQWVERRDPVWAIVMTRSALRLLEVAKDIE